MKRFVIKIKYFTQVLLILFFCGCVGFVETAGQVIDGSAFSGKVISRYRSYTKYNAPFDIIIEIIENMNKEKSLLITIEQFPMIKLRGSFPENDGAFFFTSLEYLAGNAHGFNEYTAELYGSGQLVLKEISTIEIFEPVFQVRITDARIHRYDTRITGSDAVNAMINRHDRVMSLTEWMRARTGINWRTIKNFESYWKPVLFPEMTANSKRPKDWRQNGDVFQNAQDINWNINYTERVFPAELTPVRNSGTLLRDFEEALPLIYLEYEWNNIINLLSKKIILYKIK
ncbi:MAG: hypothetical protein FWC21_00130 [Treponema sp.]|nr:hypothetical protein [Treponema sp.]